MSETATRKEKDVRSIDYESCLLLLSHRIPKCTFPILSYRSAYYLPRDAFACTSVPSFAIVSVGPYCDVESSDRKCSKCPHYSPMTLTNLLSVVEFCYHRCIRCFGLQWHPQMNIRTGNRGFWYEMHSWPLRCYENIRWLRAFLWLQSTLGSNTNSLRFYLKTDPIVHFLHVICNSKSRFFLRNWTTFCYNVLQNLYWLLLP